MPQEFYNKKFLVLVVFGALTILVFVLSEQQQYIYVQSVPHDIPNYALIKYHETMKKCGNPNSDHIKSIEEVLDIKTCSEKELERTVNVTEKLYSDRTKAIETIPGDYYKSISKEIDIAQSNSSGINRVVTEANEIIAEMEAEIKSKEMEAEDAALLADTSKEIVMINLEDASNDPIIEGMTTYELEDINTNIGSLKGIEFGSSYIKSASVTDNRINLYGAVKIPDPLNPNAVAVEDIDIHLTVEYIETSPIDGLKNFSGNSGFRSNSIGEEKFNVGKLIQRSDSTAQLILYAN
jgi:hypothetical protein